MIDVVIIGGGMIVHDQILPTMYHLQRTGVVGEISVVATSSTRLRDLVDQRFQHAFPGQSFQAYPNVDRPSEYRNTELWREVVTHLRPHSLVIVATPDNLHDEMVRFALNYDHHVLCVKPLTHNFEQTKAIEQLAFSKGLFVGVEYHKRFDRRSLEARDLYQRGRFGEFVCGDACLIEPYYYRDSNFQNWFTTDKTDAFTYIGCHYIDLVYFITGLRPVSVSNIGVRRDFPNGNTAFIWANGRVVFENGAIFSVNTGLGYPDRGAGSNNQGMVMYGEGTECGTIIQHNDQFRGVTHCYVDDSAGAHFRFSNPDYFRLVPWMGDGLKPVGYGYESVAGYVETARQISKDAGKSDYTTLKQRQHILTEIDEKGLLATPGNSFINDLAIQAARKSILADGKTVEIHYGSSPHIS